MKSSKAPTPRDGPPLNRPVNLRDLIDRERLRQDLSVNALALRSGVPQPSLAEWLTGKQATINSAHVERLLAALDLRVS